MTNFLAHTSIMTTLLVLLIPITKTMNPTPINMDWHMTQAKTAVKMAWLISMVPLLTFYTHGVETSMTSLKWTTIENFDINLSIMLDQYSTMFLPAALFVTWSILEFSAWYMKMDPQINKFFKYLLLFLLAMLTLVLANNLLLLFIGWEGVGIMSFLLIGWWFSRTDANTSALQAVIDNRIGDIGLIMTLAWLAMFASTWDLQELMSEPNKLQSLPLLGLLLAAMGKSAQFLLHPWLPAAMEGPTPVSALLHSSTMVVAGVFLLIRLHPLLQTNTKILSLCLCIGATTTLFAATCALTQNDIKKIIAFSTSSQLGLMMVTIGLNQPQLAFFHILTHAFFKAMLFLCSGALIHNLKEEQDIRKMGSTKTTLPISTTCLTIGNLAIMGTPFLAGFYSKDTIIETMNTSNLNAWALLLTLIATILTAAYTLRIIYFVQMGPTRSSPITPINENDPNLANPIIRLAVGSIIAGLLISLTIPPIKTTTMTMPPTTKLSALLITILGLIIAMELTTKTTLTQNPSNKLYHHSNQLGFFNTILHRTQPKTTLSIGQNLSTHMNDLLWYEKTGPKLTMTLNTMMANHTSSANKGLIKAYLSTFIILTALLLSLTKL
uniref:NADH-ubiquinone oxidoreductase chain 5 n=1 Tax=Smaug warreni TaxID=885424 RepID=Q6I7W4_9SAUR|nr:NADH dehydrogenase subunit 5 [Smaug warreni]BAD24760.1 NADH dehydrogenase subunit 5 [Smaug warreni]